MNCEKVQIPVQWAPTIAKKMPERDIASTKIFSENHQSR